MGKVAIAVDPASCAKAGLEHLRLGLLLDVALAVEFLPCALGRHVPNQAEDWARKPGAIEFPNNRPSYSGIAIWIPAIEFILIIENNGDTVRFGRRAAPFEDFLSLIHAHVVMHPSAIHHLQLRSIPQRIVRLSIFELLFAVEIMDAYLSHAQRAFGGPMFPRSRSCHSWDCR